MLSIEWPWGGDPQTRIPVGICARCGMEMYQYDDGEVCTACREELEGQENE